MSTWAPRSLCKLLSIWKFFFSSAICQPRSHCLSILIPLSLFLSASFPGQWLSNHQSDSCSFFLLISVFLSLALALHLLCRFYLSLFISLHLHHAQPASLPVWSLASPWGKKPWLGSLCLPPDHVCDFIKPVTLHGDQTGTSLWTLWMVP